MPRQQPVTYRKTALITNWGLIRQRFIRAGEVKAELSSLDSSTKRNKTQIRWGQQDLCSWKQSDSSCAEKKIRRWSSIYNTFGIGWSIAKSTSVGWPFSLLVSTSNQINVPTSLKSWYFTVTKWMPHSPWTSHLVSKTSLIPMLADISWCVARSWKTVKPGDFDGVGWGFQTECGFYALVEEAGQTYPVREQRGQY